MMTKEHAHIPQGGLLALDWGQRKVGYATCDELGLVVTPRSHFERKKNSPPWSLTKFDQEQLTKLLETYEPGALILGLPEGKDGRETEGARGARGLAAELEARLHKSVYLVSETLTSWQAREAKGDEDAVAASLLIEDYIRGVRMNKSKGSVSTILTGLLVLILIVTGASYKFYYDFSQKAVSSDPGEFIVDVPPQSTFFSVRNSLAKQGIVIDRFAYRFWTLSNGAEKKLRIGEYRIQKNWTPKKILDEILSGQMLLHKVTIKEGHNIYDIAETFKSTSFTQKSESIQTLLHDPKLMEKMQILALPPGTEASLEGFLFPETYSYQKYDSAKKLVDAMLEQFERRAVPILKQHPWGGTPEGRFRLVTLASIVEKESGQASEQPLIASVFWNRMAKHMRLQSDPTTIYGLLPDFDGNLKRIHLTTPSAYNTYTLPELPIAPICNPGETALRAVVEPAHTNYLFFVAKGDGSHVFSENYKTHAAYVRAYQLKKPPN